MLDRKKLAVIHIAKKELGLDEDNYREALMTWGGSVTARDLSTVGFQRVMTHFEDCGFKSGPGFARKGLRRAGRPEDSRPGRATDAQIRKVYKLWWLLSGVWYARGQERKALREFLKKRFRVDHENFLSFKKAHAVIEAVKKIGRRELG